MTKEEIYNHLAQVYLGKRNTSEVDKKRTRKRRTSTGIIVVILLIVSVFGLMAFLSAHQQAKGSNVIFALTKNPIRVPYDFTDPYPQIKSFSVKLPKMNVGKYANMDFAIRGTDDGYPGIIKILIKNKRNENASQYVGDVGLKWKKVSIPLAEFEEITDWSNITDISFVIEAWNTEKKRGAVLIEDLSFSG